MAENGGEQMAMHLWTHPSGTSNSKNQTSESGKEKQKPIAKKVQCNVYFIVTAYCICDLMLFCRF
jgi:hypothetical protein